MSATPTSNGANKGASTTPKPRRVIQGLSCKSCVKVDACALVRAIGPFLIECADPFEKDPAKALASQPFALEELAIICRKYLNKSIVQTLNGVEEDHAEE